jgi:uncharacterized phage-like protein YoqJ
MVVVLKSDYPHITLSFVMPSADYRLFSSELERGFYSKIWKEADEIENVAEHYTYNCVQKCEQYIIDSAQYCMCYALNQAKALKASVYAQKNRRTIIDLTKKSSTFR